MGNFSQFTIGQYLKIHPTKSEKRNEDGIGLKWIVIEIIPAAGIVPRVALGLDFSSMKSKTN
jgi:hypothetical protein